MKFWWVNHKQTFRQEFKGKYIWSPKRKQGGHLNRFYETMREVNPGDIVFSYAGGVIRGFGVARTHCYTSPRPNEFGHIGEVWDRVGWRVDVDFQLFQDPIRPALHMNALLPVLPPQFSPINERGQGYQHVYLANIPENMALVVAHLGSSELLGIIDRARAGDELEHEAPELVGVNEWEALEQARISEDSRLQVTEKTALISARRGQGLFRQRVSTIEHRCRITGVTKPEHLIASHIKPWREAANPERLCGANGLLLTPSIDHLFDRGFISFENGGELLVSPVAHPDSLNRMGVITDRVVNVGGFAEAQKEFLDYHRDQVFLKSLV